MSRLRLHPEDIKELGRIIAKELMPEIRAGNTREDTIKKTETLTVLEVARILSIDKTTVYSYLRQGLIKGTQVGKHWRVTQTNLENYINGKK